MKNVPVIQKEQLSDVTFQRTEVLNDTKLRQDRIHNLHRALILGNLYQNKVRIIFQTDEGLLQQVETTIWFISEDFIFLKGGIFIPVKAIFDLEL